MCLFYYVPLQSLVGQLFNNCLTPLCQRKCITLLVCHKTEAVLKIVFLIMSVKFFGNNMTPCIMWQLSYMPHTQILAVLSVSTGTSFSAQSESWLKPRKDCSYLSDTGIKMFMFKPNRFLRVVQKVGLCNSPTV